MTDCAELSVEVVPEGEHAVARFVTPSEACSLCRGREGTFSRDTDGYEVFRPCARRHVRKNLDLFNAARIGRRYAEATFDTYAPRNRSQMEALELARHWVGTYSEGRRARGGVLFWGSVGTGKTHLVLAMFRALTLEHGVACRFVDYGNLLMDLRRSFRAEAGSSEAALMLPLVHAEVLIVDELGKGRDTDWELTVLDDLISRRYNAGRVTLFTTNLSALPARPAGKGLNPAFDQRTARASRNAPPTLEERLDARIFSRLNEMADFVHVDGEDYRRTGLAVSRRRT